MTEEPHVSSSEKESSEESSEETTVPPPSQQRSMPIQGFLPRDTLVGPDPMVVQRVTVTALIPVPVAGNAGAKATLVWAAPQFTDNFERFVREIVQVVTKDGCFAQATPHSGDEGVPIELGSWTDEHQGASSVTEAGSYIVDQLFVQRRRSGGQTTVIPSSGFRVTRTVSQDLQERWVMQVTVTGRAVTVNERGTLYSSTAGTVTCASSVTVPL